MTAIVVGCLLVGLLGRPLMTGQGVLAHPPVHSGPSATLQPGNDNSNVHEHIAQFIQPGIYPSTFVQQDPVPTVPYNPYYVAQNGNPSQGVFATGFSMNLGNTRPQSMNYPPMYPHHTTYNSPMNPQAQTQADMYGYQEPQEADVHRAGPEMYAAPSDHASDDRIRRWRDRGRPGAPSTSSDPKRSDSQSRFESREGDDARSRHHSKRQPGRGRSRNSEGLQSAMGNAYKSHHTSQERSQEQREPQARPRSARRDRDAPGSSRPVPEVKARQPHYSPSEGSASEAHHAAHGQSREQSAPQFPPRSTAGSAHGARHRNSEPHFHQHPQRQDCPPSIPSPEVESFHSSVVSHGKDGGFTARTRSASSSSQEQDRPPSIPPPPAPTPPVPPSAPVPPSPESESSHSSVVSHGSRYSNRNSRRVPEHPSQNRAGGGQHAVRREFRDRGSS
ncbi:hypothetical protein P389DRAFT_87155 [Cystobasidium minutum MCA 4210]|uniref:uncharacterized protein n=1 Tax=Cystobasidium minutum MCA 4210 TaxID=1397322 RepID=UPI0034CE9F72|eukprot:jgi/Rhomi1/87155/CE87154_843